MFLFRNFSPVELQMVIISFFRSLKLLNLVKLLIVFIKLSAKAVFKHRGFTEIQTIVRMSMSPPPSTAKRKFNKRLCLP